MITFDAHDTTSERLDEIAAFADFIGVPGIARDARRYGERLVELDLHVRIERSLVQRLRHALEEYARAVDRSERQRVARIDVLTRCRVSCELVLERRARTSDEYRDRLLVTLTRARAKFLMGSRVDAHARLATTRASEIARHELARFEALGREHVRHAHRAMATDLQLDIHRGLGDVASHLPSLALAGFDVIVPRSRLRLSRLPRATLDGGSLLDALLDEQSAAIVEQLASAYDEARAATAARWCEQLDDAIVIARTAHERAQAVHEGEPDAAMRWRQQIAAWADVVSRLARRLS